MGIFGATVRVNLTQSCDQILDNFSYVITFREN